MPDVNGQTYESFVEFLLRRLGVRDEGTPGTGLQYHYENDSFHATCHTSVGLCAHAGECDRLTRHLGYGPWYDPDFVVTDDRVVRSVVSVTHWSNPRSSQYKFWRTAEEMFQYKTLFGRQTQSLNLLFEALDADQPPVKITDLTVLQEFHGWSPTNGSMHALAHDVTLAFPLEYLPLTTFQDSLPALRGTPQVRRRARMEHWEHLCSTHPQIQTLVDQAAELLGQALEYGVNPRFTPEAIGHLQTVCFNGRMRATAAPLHTTRSRYRKGIQHAYLLYLAARAQLGRDDLARQWVEQVLKIPARFSQVEWDRGFATLGHPAAAAPMQAALRALPVKMDRRQPLPMLEVAGLAQLVWNEDMAEFINGLVPLAPADREAFMTGLWDLFAQYDQAYGMNDIARDLAQVNRIDQKVDYVAARYLGIPDRATFIARVTEDMLTPGTTPPPQTVAEDQHNWVADILLEFYGLGSMQHITPSLPRKFQVETGEGLRNYAFNGNLGQLVSDLIRGKDIAEYIRSAATLNRQEFYAAIWPLFGETLWEAIQGKDALNPEEVKIRYRYKKAMRIISSPDLEPIRPMMLRSVPGLDESEVTLRGVFNQLSRFKGWGNGALTTTAGGRDPTSGAFIQTQAVVGAKNIDHKVKELASRLRSLYLDLNSDGNFEPNSDNDKHFLVIDGDWPINSKINLFEAGFQGIYEIAESDSLMNELSK